MNKISRAVLVAGSSLGALIGSAHATLPAEVTTAMTDMKTDGLIVAGGFLVAIIAFAAFKLMRKAT